MLGLSNRVRRNLEFWRAFQSRRKIVDRGGSETASRTILARVSGGRGHPEKTSPLPEPDLVREQFGQAGGGNPQADVEGTKQGVDGACLLYTSDAADE